MYIFRLFEYDSSGHVLTFDDYPFSVTTAEFTSTVQSEVEKIRNGRTKLYQMY